MGQQIAADIEDLGDHGRRHLALGDLDRGFHHRQGEALDAETILAELRFSASSSRCEMRSPFGIVGQEFGEMLFRQAVELFVLPERIVCIEADRGERAQRHGPVLLKECQHQDLPVLRALARARMRYGNSFVKGEGARR